MENLKSILKVLEVKCSKAMMNVSGLSFRQTIKNVHVVVSMAVSNAQAVKIKGENLGSVNAIYKAIQR